MALLAVEPRPAVVAIVSPPGYGKTTLLADWVARERDSAAWLTLDDSDNEPSVFLSYVAAAIDRIEPVDGSLASALGMAGPWILASAVPRLASELHRWQRPGLLILDDVHRLVDRTCLDALTALIEHLPPGFQVALSGRAAPDVALARLRVRRQLIEIGLPELALDADETRSLAAAAGLDLSADEARALTERTEGWPAAIYLATLSRNRSRPLGGVAGDVSGSEGHIAEYLRSELDPMLDADDVAILTRTSILDVVELPAAVAVTGLREANERLRHLAGENQLISRVAGTSESYRYHQLLREHLRAELDRREPGAAAALHGRAAAWFADVGRPEEAIVHSIAAGDLETTGRLVEGAFLHTYYGGHAGRLTRWLQTFDDLAFERRPTLAVIAAWVEALSGRPAAAERMADVADRARQAGTPADGTASFESSRAMLRAALARSGPEDVLANAQLAVESEGAGSRWRATALWLLGCAHMLGGDLDGADARLAESVEAASPSGTSGFFALAARASLAMGRGDWRAADQFARESHAGFMRTHLEGVVSAILVHAVAARVAIHHGDLGRGREELVHAQLVRPLASYALPWASVLALLEMARAYLAIADPGGARAVVSDAEQIVRHRPQLGVLVEAVGEVRRRLDDAARTIGGPSTLTPAELRVLPLLSTHLTFEGIGQRLHISRHTVKAHAVSIYGKLGVTSRGEAIARAVDVGLLEPYSGLRPVAEREDRA